MKKTALETRIITATPNDTSVNRSFTDKVMHEVSIVQAHNSSLQATFLEQFRKLNQLPRFAVLMFAVVFLTLFGGTTYAMYKILWAQPKVTIQTPTTNQFGRTQAIASAANCGNQKDETTFEIKQGNKLNPSEISKILQARCELEVIRNWSGEKDPTDATSRKPAQGTVQSSMIMVYPTASEVKSIDTTKLTLSANNDTPETTLTLAKDTQYIVDNHLSTKDQIQPKDPVLYVQKITTKDTTTKDASGHYNTAGIPIAKKTTYVIKTNLPFEYYNLSSQNLVAQREECMGNPSDTCVQTQLVDVYYSSTSKQSSKTHLIQGMLIEHIGNSIKLKSSSGRIFTLTTPSDIVMNFNQNKSANYNNSKIEKGDLLQVMYVADNTTNLDSTQIISIQLALDMVKKTDSIQKY